MHFGEINCISEVDNHHSCDQSNKGLGHEDRFRDVSQESNEARREESVQCKQEEEDEELSGIVVESDHEVNDGSIQKALQEQDWDVQNNLRNVVQARMVHGVGFMLLDDSAANE